MTGHVTWYGAVPFLFELGELDVVLDEYGEVFRVLQQRPALPTHTRRAVRVRTSTSSVHITVNRQYVVIRTVRTRTQLLGSVEIGLRLAFRFHNATDKVALFHGASHRHRSPSTQLRLIETRLNDKQMRGQMAVTTSGPPAVPPTADIDQLTTSPTHSSQCHVIKLD